MCGGWKKACIREATVCQDLLVDFLGVSLAKMYQWGEPANEETLVFAPPDTPGLTPLSGEQHLSRSRLNTN